MFDKPIRTRTGEAMTSDEAGPPALAGQALADLGARLKKAREAREMSTRKLAEKLKVSPGLISHIENGRSAPSVNTLYAMATVLGISLDVVFDLDNRAGYENSTPGGHVSVTRYGHRVRTTGHPGAHWEALSSADGPLLMGLLTYDAGASTVLDTAPVGHVGVEYGFVVSGVLEVRVNDDVVRLSTGDSFEFDATAPHVLSNPGPLPALVVWATPNGG